MRGGTHMALETTAILRSLLFNALKAKAMNEDIDAAIVAIKAMCTKDDISAVQQLLQEYLDEHNLGNNC
jgi:hypothetical protein